LLTDKALNQIQFNFLLLHLKYAIETQQKMKVKVNAV
jgi:hypothetical protein